MLDKALKTLEQEILKRAVEAISQPINPAHAAFEAGRRQGVHQGLTVAKALIEELINGDNERERANR